LIETAKKGGFSVISGVNNNSSVGFSTVGRGGGSSIGINNFPPNTPTAGLSPYTDAEIKEKLWDLARREVAAGNYAWSETSARNSGTENNEEFRRLMTFFQSNISPDRVGAVNNQVSGMSRGLNLPALRHNQNMQIFDMLIRALGQSGRNPNVGVNFITFTDNTGFPVAKYMQGGGLSAGLREDELQRGGELSLLFKEMKAQVKSKEGNTDALIDMKRSGHQVDLSLWSNKGQAFNMERLAANGITFDSATGQTNVDQSLLTGQPTQNQQQVMNRYAENMGGNN
jgi:hypothetical protein